MNLKQLGTWKCVSALCLVTVVAGPALSAWEVSPFVGGRTGGSISIENATYDKLDFKDAMAFGLSVGADVSDEGAVEVLWSHQNTILRGRLAGTNSREDITDVSADQFLLTGLYYLYEGKLRPFALAGVGGTIWNPKNGYDSVTRLSWALGGGVKYYLTPRFGLRADARWVPTVSQSDSSVFCASNAGGTCLVSSSGSMIDQFEFAASAILRFGGSTPGHQEE